MALQSVCVKRDGIYNDHVPIDKPSYKKNDKQFNKGAKCICCNEQHSLYKCQLFLKKDTHDRFNFAKSKQLCLNCLFSSHKTHDCKSKYSCKYCKKHHHSLLHLDAKKGDERNVRANVSQLEQANEHIFVQATVAAQQASKVLLATAMIGVTDKNGSPIMLRALMDQGSQSAFISENAAQTLKLQRLSISATVTGIGETPQSAKHAMNVTITPRFQSEFAIYSQAIVLRKLTKVINYAHDENDFNFLNKLTLADPSFLRESEIDMILGAAEYAHAIKMGLVKSEKYLIAQNTEFGWIVSGAINGPRNDIQLVAMVTNIELTATLNNFFNSEEFENEVELTEEELYCEEHFKQHCYQNDNGQFVITIPFKDGMEQPDLGDSRKCANILRLNYSLSADLVEIQSWEWNIPSKFKMVLIWATLKKCHMILAKITIICHIIVCLKIAPQQLYVLFTTHLKKHQMVSR